MTDKEQKKLEKDDVVQLNPETVGNKAFAGCFMVITEAKSWGAQGYIQGVGEVNEAGGQYYYRARHEEMVKIGKATWVAE